LQTLLRTRKQDIVLAMPFHFALAPPLSSGGDANGVAGERSAC
jgi:hypothetical protein